MRIVYFGSDRFGIPVLAEVGRIHDVAAIVTAPDKPGKRGMKLISTPVKEWAIENNVRAYLPEKLDKTFAENIRRLCPDIILVISYGKRLTPEILASANNAAINLHPSLLPLYRGPAPMEWALIKGEKVTGLSVIKMTPEIDRGDIILQEACPVKNQDDIFALREKLSRISARIVIKSLEILESGKEPELQKQEESRRSYARKLRKDDGIIDWNRDATEIRNLVRGVAEWPGARTCIRTGSESRYIKLFRTEAISKEDSPGRPGEVINVNRDSIEVACKSGALKIYELQMAGKKRLRASEFLKGTPVVKGDFMESPPETACMRRKTGKRGPNEE